MICLCDCQINKMCAHQVREITSGRNSCKSRSRSTWKRKEEKVFEILTFVCRILKPLRSERVPGEVRLKTRHFHVEKFRAFFGLWRLNSSRNSASWLTLRNSVDKTNFPTKKLGIKRWAQRRVQKPRAINFSQVRNALHHKHAASTEPYNLPTKNQDANIHQRAGFARTWTWTWKYKIMFVDTKFSSLKFIPFTLYHRTSKTTAIQPSSRPHTSAFISSSFTHSCCRSPTPVPPPNISQHIQHHHHTMKSIICGSF